jgi:hypothetical protein
MALARNSASRDSILLTMHGGVRFGKHGDLVFYIEACGTVQVEICNKKAETSSNRGPGYQEPE